MVHLLRSLLHNIIGKEDMIMKERYESLEIEVIEFDSEDVITTSEITGGEDD